MSDTSLPSRVAWMDLARVVAAFWVVMIHVAAVPVVHMSAIPPSWWWWANAYNCLSRAAVPLFVMLSGALLLTSTSFETGRFFRRRAAKLLPPLLGWTLIYEAWRMWLRHEHVGLGEFARNLLDGLDAPAYPHLWFLWIIGSLYLLTPLLQPFVAQAGKVTRWYVVGLWLVTTAVLPLFSQWAGWSVGVLIQMPSFGYVGYYVAGALLLQGMKPRLAASAVWGLVTVFMAAAGASMWGTYVLSRATGHVDESMMSPLSGTVILMSLSAFMLLRHIGTPEDAGDEPISGVWRDRLSQVSVLSFGIYLVHPWVLDGLDLWCRLSLDPLRHHPAWYAPMMAVLTFTIAALFTAMLQRLPGLRRLVP